MIDIRDYQEQIDNLQSLFRIPPKIPKISNILCITSDTKMGERSVYYSFPLTVALRGETIHFVFEKFPGISEDEIRRYCADYEMIRVDDLSASVKGLIDKLKTDLIIVPRRRWQKLDIRTRVPVMLVG